MPERIYVPVGKPLDLSATVDGAPEVDAIPGATFEVFRLFPMREVLATLQGTLTGRRAEAQWPSASGPAPTEMSALLHYRVAAADLAFDGEEVIVVYRDTVEVTAVDAQNAPVPNALFKLTVSGDGPETSTTRRTDANGIARVQRLPPGKITVEWLDPFELRGWIQGTGPSLRATVARRTYKAEFRFPARDVSSHEQLVNVPRDDAQWECGNLMRVKVGVRLGAQAPGDELYLKAVFKATERTEPVRTIVGGVQAGLTSTHHLPVDGDGTATFEVELGHGGGDEVTLTTGSTDQCADGTVKVVSWRRVLYQLTAPDRWHVDELPGPVKGPLEKEYAKAFIRFEQDGDAVAWDSTASPVLGLDFYVGNPEVFKTAFDPIVFSNASSSNFYQFLRDPGMRYAVPYFRHVVLISHLAESFPANDYNITMTGTDSGWVPATAGTLLGIAVDRTVLRSTMTWTTTGTVAAMAFDAAWITVDADSTGKRFKVRLPPTVIDPSGAGPSRRNPLLLSLTLQGIKPDAAGRSTGSTIATTYKPAKPRQMAYAIIHEFGHAFNQSIVAADKVPGLDIADHDTRYGAGTGEGQHGHAGPHCRQGLSKVFKTSADYSKAYSKWGAHGSCVMWGGALKEKDSGSSFCDKCMRFLKACEL